MELWWASGTGAILGYQHPGFQCEVELSSLLRALPIRSGLKKRSPRPFPWFPIMALRCGRGKAYLCFRLEVCSLQRDCPDSLQTRGPEPTVPRHKKPLQALWTVAHLSLGLGREGGMLLNVSQLCLLFPRSEEVCLLQFEENPLRPALWSNFLTQFQ